MKQKGFSVDVKGLDDVIRMLEHRLGKQAVDDIDDITEGTARQMAKESAEMAPVKSGKLAGTIAGSVQRSDELHVWEWGSDQEYATRQEYEHKTHKGFIRKAIWNNREKYRKAVLKRISRG